MKLYLEKRGCDFRSDDPVVNKSDLENYRLYCEFIDRDGKRIRGDVGRAYDKTFKHYDRLRTDFTYDNYDGSFSYEALNKGEAPLYTKANALKLVNSVSAVQYDAVEIVDELPDAAHDYPPDVLMLEAEYLRGEHKKLYEHVEQLISSNPRNWLYGYYWALHQMTPEEYKRLTLLAFEQVADKSFDSCITGRLTRYMLKHLFKEQDIFDPRADLEFLAQLTDIAPEFTATYIAEATPYEFDQII